MKNTFVFCPYCKGIKCVYIVKSVTKKGFQVETYECPNNHTFTYKYRLS